MGGGNSVVWLVGRVYMAQIVLNIGFSGKTVKSVYYFGEEVGRVYCEIVFLVENLQTVTLKNWHLSPKGEQIY